MMAEAAPAPGKTARPSGDWEGMPQAVPGTKTPDAVTAPVRMVQQLFKIFEDASDLVLLVNAEGRLAFANRVLREALGYSQEEIASRTVYDLTIQTDHAACQAWLQKTVSERDPTGRIRLTFLGKTGKKVPVEGRSVVRVQDDKLALLHWTFRDLSEFYRAEATHREREELFHLLTRHAPVGVFRTDTDGRLSYCNERWRSLAGLWHSPQPRGVWWQMVHPAHRDQVLPVWAKAMTQETECGLEFRVNVPDDGERWVRTRLVPARLSGDPQTCWIGITEDITTAREAQHQLRAAKDELEQRVAARTAELATMNAELAEFAYVVTHDLKAPLRGVQQLSEWIARDHAAGMSDEGLQMFGLLRQRVQHLQQLVDGLLALARVGRNPEPEMPVDTGELVQKILLILAPPAHIKIQLDPGLPTVNGNPERLQQIFQNLLDNAIKYLNKRKGRIQVEAAPDAEAWRFVVADNGPGIPSRYHDKVFQIFQRLEGGPEVPGTGLGLSLVKRIIESRGGRIWIESDAGQGTRMHFTWPNEKRGGPPITEFPAAAAEYRSNPENV